MSGEEGLMKPLQRLGLLLGGLLCAALVMATPERGAPAAVSEPYQLIQQTTERVLEIVSDAKAYYEEDPRRFHAQIEEVMAETVDFDTFARGVMGRHASARHYQSLDEREKAQFRMQVQRFTDSFKRGLIQTYAKGLLRFDGQRIETFPGRPTGSSVTVMQHIFGKADKPYVVQYTLRRDRAGVWKVRNVIIEGINFGQTYRNQFDASMQQHKGDLDQVIASWHVEPEAIRAVGVKKGAPQ